MFNMPGIAQSVTLDISKTSTSLSMVVYGGHRCCHIKVLIKSRFESNFKIQPEFHYILKSEYKPYSEMRLI